MIISIVEIKPQTIEDMQFFFSFFNIYPSCKYCVTSNQISFSADRLLFISSNSFSMGRNGGVIKVVGENLKER